MRRAQPGPPLTAGEVGWQRELENLRTPRARGFNSVIESLLTRGFQQELDRIMMSWIPAGVWDSNRVWNSAEISNKGKKSYGWQRILTRIKIGQGTD